MTQRPIKFRAWDGESMWIFNLLSMSDHLGNRLREEHPIVMQSTGLLDKNGKEIYEGDIMTKGTNVVGKVYFENGMFLCENFGYTGNWSTCEVIGNIYENPELL